MKAFGRTADRCMAKGFRGVRMNLCYASRSVSVEGVICRGLVPIGKNEQLKVLRTGQRHGSRRRQLTSLLGRTPGRTLARRLSFFRFQTGAYNGVSQKKEHLAEQGTREVDAAATWAMIARKCFDIAWGTKNTICVELSQQRPRNALHTLHTFPGFFVG